MELHDHDDVFRTDDGAPNPKPDSFMSSSITGQPLNRWKKPYFTWAVITVNVLVFFAMMVVAKFEFVSQSFNPLIGPSIDVLDTYVVAPIADEKRWMSLQIIDRFGLDWGGAKNVNAIRGGRPMVAPYNVSVSAQWCRSSRHQHDGSKAYRWIHGGSFCRAVKSHG